MGRPESLFLPPRTHISNLSPQIIDWRQSCGPILGVTEQDRAPHKLVTKPISKFGENSQIELDCITREGEWTVAITPQTEMLLTRPSELTENEVNDIAEQLTIRQRLYLPNGFEQPHARAINFLARNWKYLRNKLYPHEQNGQIPAYCFTEVLTDETKGSRADLVGFGPDGRLLVLEFGKGKKEMQVQGYARDLKSIFSDFGLSVSPFVAYYSDEKDTCRIDIKPTYKDHMNANQDAVNQFFKRIKRRPEQDPSHGNSSSLHEFELFVKEFRSRLREKEDF